MKPTNEELRVAFDELKRKMGLQIEKSKDWIPFLINKEYSESELIMYIMLAIPLIEPYDKYTTRTKEIINYIKNLKS